MAKFGINDILSAKARAAGAHKEGGYKEVYLSPYEVKAAAGAANGLSEDKGRVFHNRRAQAQRRQHPEFGAGTQRV